MKLTTHENANDRQHDGAAAAPSELSPPQDRDGLTVEQEERKATGLPVVIWEVPPGGQPQDSEGAGGKTERGVIPLDRYRSGAVHKGQSTYDASVIRRILHEGSEPGDETELLIQTSSGFGTVRLPLQSRSAGDGGTMLSLAAA